MDEHADNVQDPVDDILEAAAQTRLGLLPKMLGKKYEKCCELFLQWKTKNVNIVDENVMLAFF